MPVHQNTYRKLDRDTAYNKVDPTSYYDCRNFRITSNDPSKSGALSSVKGNKPLSGDFSTVGYPDDKIIGNVPIRDKMIIFTTNNDETSPTSSYGRIWSAPFTDDAVNMNDIDLLYSGLLNFSMQHPIEDAVAFYENEDLQKIYWTDNYNDLRFCNIADPDLSTKDPDEFNIVQQFYSATPQFSKMISGSIPVGMIQYAFRLYKLNGPVSNFSNTSQLIPLTEYSLSSTNTYKFKGSDRLDSQGNALSSGKGITMTIDLSSVSTDNYDRIEVVAIHYSALNEVPNIYIVEVKPISSIITFTDEGIYNLGSYSLSEFNLVNNPFKCKTIATKNNILFAGNIQQSEFDVDFDARAYRWTQSRQCRLDEANGEYWINQAATNTVFTHYNSSGVSLGSVSGMVNLPEDIDAICRNNIEYDRDQTSYIYKSDGSTVGGEGPNVSYTFSVSNSYKIDYQTGSLNDDFGVEAVASPYYYNGSESPYYNQRIRTWQRDEIYRYGLILIDNKGRYSPVKWIADIRIPNNAMVVSTYTGFNRQSSTVTYSHPIQVDFQIANLPSDVIAVKIVYVKRTDKDRTVKLQGFASFVHTPWPFAYNVVAALDNSTIAGFNSAAAKHISIFSPEISFYKNFSQGVNDYIEVVGTYSGTVYNGSDSAAKTQFNRIKMIGFTTAGVGRTSNVVTSRIQNTPDSPDEEINNETFGSINNFKAVSAYNSSGTNFIGNIGTCLLVQLNSVLPLSGLTTTNRLLVNYRSNLFGSQYGGYTYEDRTRNEYIPASDQKEVSAGSVSISAIYGDTYINYSDHLTSYYNDYYAKLGTLYGYPAYTYASNIFFPVETTVNLAYRLDDCYHIIHESPAAYFIREKNNAEFTVASDVTYSPGWTDLYLENTVYKRISDVKKYYPAPIDYTPEFKNDALVMASNMKEGLETFDAWTQWATNESINVDKKYGPVNKLISWKNYLLYWQDDAVGALSVLDRSVVSDVQGRSTTLGQGEILQRYDNIATNIGLNTRFSIASSINGIYWYDNKRRKISRFLNTIEDMSTIRGVNSYLNGITSDYGQYDNVISPTRYMKGFFMSYNPMYNEIWFTVKSSIDSGLALIYNEVVDGFTGFVDTTAYYYMPFHNKVFSAYDKYIYKEDKGYPGLFFGRYYDSYVSVVVNPIPNIVTTLTNLEISSEVYETELAPEIDAIDVPTLTTNAMTSVTGTGAVSGGNITHIGGLPITQRGVCYGPTSTPLIENDSHTSDGTGPGSFVSTVRGLIPASQYYLRAYAVNAVGTGYGAVRSFITTVPAIINTSIISNITESTADCGWELLEDGGEAPIECGLCWSTSTGPTTADDKVSQDCSEGTYTYTIAGLTDSTFYYVRAYAINSKGTVYGLEKAFNTTYLYAPTLNTYAASGVSIDSAASGGYNISDGGTPITERGICYSTSPTPTTSSSKVIDSLTGTTAFISSLSSLSDNTLYYVRAYAINKKGTSYGNQITFSTLDLTTATVSTTAISDIRETGCHTGGNVTHDGYATVTERGVCYSTSSNPTIADSKVVDSGTGEGSFTCSIPGLIGGTTYYVRAYATNSQGTAYGENRLFTTIYISTPTVITTDPTSITYNGATTGGNVLSENGATVTEKGIYCGTNTNPVLNTKFPYSSAGVGSWVKVLNTLDDATTFYVNAYAINSRGIAYGNQVSFTTLDALPGTVSTSTISSILYNSALGGGNVTADGGSPITAKGVCWSTSLNPTVADSHTTDGTGLGSFVSDISSLTTGTTYYVRAYATNVEGTSYGANVSFTTLVKTAPVISINPIGLLTETTVVVSANLLNTGGDTVTEYGFCWGTSINPTTSGTHYNVSPGSFSYTIGGLSDATSYYVRAYATNGVGTTYSDNISFTTLSYLVASVQTLPVTGLGQTYLTANGNVANDGGAIVTEKGFYFGEDPIPIMNTKYDVGSGIGLFSQYFSGLTPGTYYYTTAYAINSKGTVYGSRITSFTVPLTAPVVQTVDVTTVRTISARAYGLVVSDGGAPVTGRGFTCSTSPGSTTPYASSGSGTGSFNAVIGSLTAGTTYYLRAYATNSQGTTYGDEISFTTLLSIGPNAIMDIDGNVYNVITIGSQQWMVEDLRVTHYADGTAIPQVTDNTTFRDDITGCYTYYNNDSSYRTTYGCLYNGYAIVNPRNIVYVLRDDVLLTGWRVPSIDDFVTLANTVMSLTSAGGLLKEAGTTHWASPNTRANNAYGFTCRPGGMKDSDNNAFINMTLHSNHWATSGPGIPVSLYENYARMFYNSAELSASVWNIIKRNNGLSVRLMRDV